MAENNATMGIARKKEMALELFRSDSYTTSEIIEKVKVARSTFYEWVKKDDDFRKKIEESRETLRNLLVMDAKLSLRKLISGFTATESTVVTIPNKQGKKDAEGKVLPEIKEQRTVQKYYAPNTTAIIFALTNLCPDDWKSRQELSGNVDGKLEVTEHKIMGSYSLSDVPDDILRKFADYMQEAAHKREVERRGER